LKSKNFKLNKENFLNWIKPLRRHLITNDLDNFIKKEIQFSKMTRSKIKTNNAVESIIINGIEKANQKYL